MIIPFLFPLLVAETGIRPPLAGYLETVDGWLEIYGVRGNFLAGERLPREVVSAAAFDRVRVWKTEQELVVVAGERESRRAAPPGRAWFASEGDAVFIWLPEAGELVEWSERGWRVHAAARVPGEPAGFAVRGGKPVALERTAEALAEIEVESGAVRSNAGEPLGTFDAEARLWTAREDELRCLDRSWRFEESISALAALGRDWVVVTHGGNRSAVRCDSDEVNLLPAP